MALEAGSVFVRLVGLFDAKEFDKWDKAVDSERTKSDKPIEIKLGADTKGLDKDLTEARGKVSRWARTQDRFNLTFSRGSLDESLAEARTRIGAWGQKDNKFNLTFGKGQLASALAEARSIIGNWGDYENKFQLSYAKGHLAAQLVEARTQIKAGLKDIDFNINVNTSKAMAQIATVRAASDAMGAGGGGVVSGGGGGGGGVEDVAAAAADGGGGGGGGGGFESGLQNVLFRRGGPRIPGTRLRIPLGGFSLATVLGLGPEHLVGAVGALAGSGAGAVGGAGALGLGALGQFAVGGGSDLAVTKSTITDTQTLSKALDAVTQAQARYGKGSTQAKNATFALNQQIKDLGNTAGVRAEVGLAKAAGTLNEFWDKQTSAARVASVHILDQVLHLGTDYVPRVANAAQQNLTIINRSIRPLFAWLEGPHGIKIWNDLEREFRRNIPTAMDALTNGIELVLRLMDLASKYTGGFTKALDDHLKKWNQLNDAYLNSKIAKLVADFRLWEALVIALSHDLVLLFRAGSGEGNDLVATLTHALKVFGDWEASARGQSFLHQFFYNREQEMKAILSLVGTLLTGFFQIYAALQPLVPAVTLFIRSASTGLSQLLTAVITPVAKVLSEVLTAFVKLGEQSNVFKDAVIVPLGAALISFRLFGATATKSIFNVMGHVRALGSLLTGLRAASAAIFAGEGVGSAWQRLKDAMRPEKAGSPAASMEEAIVSGGKVAGEEISAAMIAASREVAAAIGGAEAAGGKVAAGEIAVGEQLGLGASAGASFAGAAAHEGEQLSLLATEVGPGQRAALEAARPGRLGRFIQGASRVGRGVARSLPIIGGGYLATEALSHASQRGDPLARIAGGAVVGATGGAVATSISGPGALVGALGGGLAGAAAGAASLLFGGGESRAQKSLDSFTKKIKEIRNPAALSARQIDNLQAQATKLAREVPKAEGPLNTLWHRLNSLPAAINAHRWNQNFNEAWTAVRRFSVQGGESINNIKDRFETNMRLIAHTVGLNSDAGRKLAQENFDKMRDRISSDMNRGVISVRKGMDLMKSAADNGTQGMRDDLAGHYAGIVKDIQNSWKKGNTTTQNALISLRQIYKGENDTIRKDIQSHYNHLLNDAKTSYDNGEITTRQYTARRTRLHQQMAHDIAAAEVKLSTSSGRIIDGLNTATASGMDALFKELNRALESLNVREVKWGVSKVTHVTIKSLGNISSEIPFINNAAPASPGHTQHQGFAGGGRIPGSEFGLGDEMTLVDPTGRPRAKMAGDELIFTRHQAPYVEAGLQMLGFNGAEDLWSSVDRPHGYERGGQLALQKFQRGGTPNFPANFDGKPSNVAPAVREIIGLMEHRFPNLVVTATRNGGHAQGSLHYMGDAVDMAADPATMINAANYVMMSGLYKNLLEGIHNPNLSIKNGKRVSPGFWGASTWAEHANHLHLAASSLTGGLTATGGGAQGAFGVWNDVGAPTINGPGGPLQHLAQAVVNKATNAANRYGRNKAGAMDFSGITGGGSNIQNQALGLKMMLAAGWGSNQWPALRALWTQESGWSSTAVNPSSGAYGIPQSLGHGHPYNLGDAKAQIAWGLNYIRQRYGSPNAAEAHERRFNWYNVGGRLPGFNTGGGLPGFRRGGRPVAHTARRPVAHKPKRRAAAHKPQQRTTSKATSLVKYIDTVPGLKQFSADDAAIAKLDSLYNRQEQIYQQYDTDPTTGNLPTDDLNVLFGIRAQEWNILQGEYKLLPGILSQLNTSLKGRRVGGGHQDPHGRVIDPFGSNAQGPHRVGGGINSDVNQLEKQINDSDKEVVNLRKELARDLQKERTARHNYSARALKIADSTAAELTKNANAIDNNLEAANRVTDQISNIPTPQRAHPTAGLHGASYAQAQSQNRQISRSNAALARQRHDLAGKRRRILDGNVPLHKEHDKIMAQKRTQASRLRHEGFDAAWAYSLQRYRIDTKIFDIQQKIKLLKQKLAREKNLQKEYQGAADAITTRLHGGDASDPSATSIIDQMGDIGFDILSLAQEGAQVPQALTGDIIKILQKLGVKIPPGLAGASGPGSTTTGAAAFDDFLAFQASRAALFAQFGSNFVAAGQNPYGTPAQIAAGSQYYGAAAGVAGGGTASPYYPGPVGQPPTPPGGGDTNITINQNFAAGPPNPHTYTASLQHELSAQM